MIDRNNFNSQVIFCWSNTSAAYNLSVNKILYSWMRAVPGVRGVHPLLKKCDSDSEQAQESTGNIYCTNITVIQ